MKYFLLGFIIFCFTPMLFSQNHWTSHNINAVVSDIYIESPQKVWLVTNNGLCSYNTLTSQYDTCYNSSNSNLSGTPSQVIYGKNRLWVKTSNGLSSLNGTTFTNYTTANGLISNSITDMAVDTSGQLWLGSIQGVSFFNGIGFVHDSLISALQIAVDDSNRVFALGSPNIANFGTFGVINVKVDTGWQQQAVSGIATLTQGGPVISNYTLKKEGNELVILSSSSNSYDGGYYKLSYPARIDSVNLSGNVNSSAAFRITDLEIDVNGKKWATSKSQYASIFSELNSTLHPHYLDQVRSLTRDQIIRTKDSLVVVSLDQQLFTSSIYTEPTQKITEDISINSIRTSANAIGPIFNDYVNSRAGFEMPKGNNSYGIFNANLMVSAKRNGDSVFVMNQLGVFNPNFDMGPVNNSAGLGGNWITKISQQDIQNHIANYTQLGYIVPENIADWKGNGDVSAGMAYQLADFVDVNSNQVYEPALGEYPIIKGDEAIYWINHKHQLEYHGMLYGFNRPSDSALNQSLFLDYKIINRDVVAYDSIKMGLFVDFDLGNFQDDYIGCDSMNNIFYVYNGDAFDESANGTSGFGANIPFVGVKFLSDSMDGFISYISGAGTNGDPQFETDWHNYLNSRWKNNSPLLYGGNGLNSQGVTTIPTKYMYTGGSWTEDNPGGGALPNQAGDRRALGHIPYFSLQPSQSKTVSMSVGYGIKTNGGRLGSLTTLIKILDSASVFWDDSLLTSIIKNQDLSEGPTMMIYPNPAKEEVFIQVGELKGEVINQTIEIYSLEGLLVKQEDLRQEKQLINISDLAKGIYLVRIGNWVKKLVVQ